MILQCCQCKKVRTIGYWIKIAELHFYMRLIIKASFQNYNVTHGYCPECLVIVKQEIQEIKECSKLQQGANR